MQYSRDERQKYIGQCTLMTIINTAHPVMSWELCAMFYTEGNSVVTNNRLLWLSIKSWLNLMINIQRKKLISEYERTALFYAGTEMHLASYGSSDLQAALTP